MTIPNVGDWIEHRPLFSGLGLGVNIEVFEVLEVRLIHHEGLADRVWVKAVEIGELGKPMVAFRDTATVLTRTGRSETFRVVKTREERISEILMGKKPTPGDLLPNDIAEEILP